MNEHDYEEENESVVDAKCNSHQVMAAECKGGRKFVSGIKLIVTVSCGGCVAKIQLSFFQLSICNT